jgi:hypothetical protein
MPFILKVKGSDNIYENKYSEIFKGLNYISRNTKLLVEQMKALGEIVD